MQLLKEVPIDESSLPGYCAINQEQIIIRNASTSALYNNFKIKFEPYILPTKEAVQASSIACVPILKEKSCKLVVLAFNKLDEAKSLSYFTEIDLMFIEALGLLTLNKIDTSKQINDLESKLENVKNQMNEGTKIISLGVETVSRRNCLNDCITALKTSQSLTNNHLQQICQAMMCDGMIFHVCQNEALKPIMALGIENFDYTAPSTKTSEYSTFVLKEILNVNDLVSEPLWDFDKIRTMKSLLTCPILNNEKYPIGCIEFLRKAKSFNAIDEKFAKTILNGLALVKYDNLNLMSNISSEMKKNTEIERNKFNRFELNPEEMYDFSTIFSEIKTSVASLISLDSCTIYIADQLQKTLWTQQSENCDSLSQPISDDTLFGYVYSNKQRVVLPDKIHVSDLGIYDKFGIIQPLISAVSNYPVIGLLSVFRSQSPFTIEEQEVLEIISSRVSGLLEYLWIFRNEKETVQQNIVTSSRDESPESRFILSNSKKKTPTPIHPPKDIDFDQNYKSTTKNNSIYSLANISSSKIGELKSMLDEIKSKPDQMLNILTKRLRQLIPCQFSKLFIIDQQEQHLIDVSNNNVAKPSGLINLCMHSQEFICIKAGASENVYFDKHIDSLGSDTQVESFLAVPIIIDEKSYGVLAFANGSINFGPEDIAMADFLSIIPRDYLKDNNQNIKNLREAIEISRKHKLLQQWCKQVFFVSNSMQNKVALIRDILSKLYEEKNFEKLVKAGLEIVCALLNAEQAAVAFQDNGYFMEYLFKKSKLIKRSHLEDEGLLIKAIEKMRSISLESVYGKENIMVVPYSEKNMPSIVVKAYNKRDETLSYYCNFNKEDEQILADFAMNMSIAFETHDKGETPDNLKQFIRQHTSSLNSHSLISTIRAASQKLLECDRATVFMIEGKEMIVSSQGMEKEIPGGFRIPIGRGIIGNVAQTGQTENIQDVYEDPRFDPAMDKKTGYRTTTMLCMPVIDNNGKVIAAMQMINKKKGYFNEADEETLLIFSEIISSALQNCKLFMHTISERSRILNILNSIGNYIIVFNGEGFMEYANKSIKGILGISKKMAFKNHYSAWLRENRQLVLDITSVLQNSKKKINRKSQKLVGASVQRRRTLPNLTKVMQADAIESHFHYSIVSVQNFSSSDTPGVVLILEDASAIYEYHLKLEKLHKEVQSMRSSIYGETSLQKCIQKLTVISNSIEDSSIRLYIDDVIKTLKQGDLDKPDIFQGQTNIQGISAKAISEYLHLESPDSETRYTLSRSFSKEAKESIDVSILNNLHDINLDPFTIDDHFPYINAMFQDFGLIDEISISTSTLMNFSNKVKEHYSLWNNPFHNFYHGFNVLHATYMMLSSSRAGTFFIAEETFALFFAALCHDLEHPGRNNFFEINRGSHLALIYNDRSVLENHHCAVAFKILQDPNSNLIASFTNEEKKSFRKLVIVSILATDMSHHVELITTLDSRLKDTSENPLKRPNDTENLAKLLIHSADLFHPCTDVEIYQKWSRKVCEEFTLQYKEEISLGLPTTEIMKDLDKQEVYYAKEFGFLKFAIKPLWDCVNLWLNPHINQYLENLNENISIFQKLKEDNQKSNNN